MNVLKAVVALFNFLFVLAGLLLTILGIVSYVYKDTVAVKHIVWNDNLTSPNFMVDGYFKTAAILVLVSGTILIINAFFGILGTRNNSYWMLMTYAVILLILFVIQVATGIYATVLVNAKIRVFKEEYVVMSKAVEEGLQLYFKDYEKSKEVQDYFDGLQRKYKCCGVVGGFTNYGVTLPLSCCPKTEDTCHSFKSYYKPGCAEVLTPIITSWVHNAVYVIEGFAVGQLIGALCAILLAYLIRNKPKRIPGVSYTPNMPVKV